jgi:PAS domain-containing protein
MSLTAPASLLTGVERFLEHDEILVSKTDRLGKITYANGPFIHISGYSEQELVGQPHSIVRHPKMPRVIFRLRLGEGLNNEVDRFLLLLRGRPADDAVPTARVPTAPGPERSRPTAAGAGPLS